MEKADESTHDLRVPEYSNIQVISYLVTTHHDFTRHIMDEISELISEAPRQLTEPMPALERLTGMWKHYHRNMINHLGDEEEILFPWIEQQGSGGEQPAMNHAIEHMLADHKHHEEEMEQVKKLADELSEQGGYIPVLAQLAYKLRQLNADLKEHMQIETELLFPRMLARPAN
jgi:regulator of cell morphogenesis and NO signaling